MNSSSEAKRPEKHFEDFSMREVDDEQTDEFKQAAELSSVPNIASTGNQLTNLEWTGKIETKDINGNKVDNNDGEDLIHVKKEVKLKILPPEPTDKCHHKGTPPMIKHPRVEILSIQECVDTQMKHIDSLKISRRKDAEKRMARKIEGLEKITLPDEQVRRTSVLFTRYRGIEAEDDRNSSC